MSKSQFFTGLGAGWLKIVYKKYHENTNNEVGLLSIDVGFNMDRIKWRFHEKLAYQT